ncbi:MAG: type secretion system-associated lipoprotein [Francisellaceae bacterium]|nr:type secretion system-associated lipoprotein [Francisellaceae bacterium]
MENDKFKIINSSKGKKMKQYAKLLFCGYCLLLVTACQSSHNLKLNINTHAQLNESLNKESLPVLIKAYQLNSSKKFKDANFKDLWKEDKKYLAQDVVSYKEFMVSPNTHQIISFPLESKAQYIGIAALFRESESSTWHAIKALPTIRINPVVKIKIEANRLEII